MKKRKYYDIVVCDYCGDTCHDKCYICGKDVCDRHGLGVRGFGDRTICIQHVQDGDYEKAFEEKDEDNN